MQNRSPSSVGLIKSLRRFAADGGGARDASVILAVFAAIAIFGASLGTFIVRDYSRARASLGWPQIDAVMLSDQKGSSANTRLRYAYSVDGRSYQSRRYRFFTKQAATNTNVPKAGSVVRIYVDPNNPRVSVIDPGGAAWIFVAMLFLGGACVFLGVGGVVRTIFSPREDEAAQSEVKN